MEENITALEGVTVTGSIGVVLNAGQVGLYMSAMKAVSRTKAPFYNYEATLTALSFRGATPVTPSEIAIPLPLSIMPRWDAVFTDAGIGKVAYTVFGGGWNTLNVDAYKDSELKSGYTYDIKEIDRPYFLIQSAQSPAKQQYVSAIFSGYQLGIIDLQSQDGQQATKVLSIVGSSEAPVSAGRVWGDLSNDHLPASLNLVYKTNKNVGPLAPSGVFCGSLFFATFDVNAAPKDALGKSVPLLASVEFSDFDLAVGSSGEFCLFAVTGDGSPLLATFDSAGNASGSPYTPVGAWSNAGGWVSNPTIVATPSVVGGFSFAFIEMDGDTPFCIQTGTVTP